MARAQEVLAEKESEWGTKVKVFGVSLDEECKTVVDHVKEKGWEKVHHY